MRNFTSIVVLGLLTVQTCMADVTGTWKGSTDLGAAGLKITGGSPSQMKVPVIKLNLKKGGTYESTIESPNGGPKQVREGTWTQKGTEITLTPSADTLKKFPTAKVQTLVVGAGENTLTSKVKAQVGVGSKPDPSAKPIVVTVVYKR